MLAVATGVAAVTGFPAEVVPLDLPCALASVAAKLDGEAAGGAVRPLAAASARSSMALRMIGALVTRRRPDDAHARRSRRHRAIPAACAARSEEHTSELQSRPH